MSKTILCQVPRAKHPYYVQDIDLNLYSIEELCCYIDQNLALVDLRFFGESLQAWLREELGLGGLADRLRDADDEDGLKGRIMAVNAEISWLDPTEENTIRRELDKIQHLPLAIRMRRKGDALVRYQKYARAIECYRQVLGMLKDTSLGEQFAGIIYHNMGVVYSRLFQMDEACECMKNAYERLHSMETLKNYLYCIWMSSGEEAFDVKADELQVDEQTRQEMRLQIAGLQQEQAPEDVDKALGSWVRDYHRQTGM